MFDKAAISNDNKQQWEEWSAPHMSGKDEGA
jgi:hypothetical protein